MTIINRTQVRKVCELILDKLDKYENIELIDVDMYWQVSPPSCYDMTKEPELEVGSLKDDVEELLKLANDSEERPVSFVDFGRLASVLHAISESLNPTE